MAPDPSPEKYIPRISTFQRWVLKRFFGSGKQGAEMALTGLNKFWTLLLSHNTIAEYSKTAAATIKSGWDQNAVQALRVQALAQGTKAALIGAAVVGGAAIILVPLLPSTLGNADLPANTRDQINEQRSKTENLTTTASQDTSASEGALLSDDALLQVHRAGEDWVTRLYAPVRACNEAVATCELACDASPACVVSPGGNQLHKLENCADCMIRCRQRGCLAMKLEADKVFERVFKRLREREQSVPAR